MDNEPPSLDHLPDRVPDKYPDEHDYPTYGKNKPKKRTGRKLAVMLVIIVVLVAAGAGGYLFWHKSKAAPAKTTGQAQQASNAAAPTPTPVPTTHYDSVDYNLGLDYPNGWTLADPPGGKLTVISPAQTLTSATGQSDSAKIMLTIQSQQSSLPDFTAGNAVAVLGSVRVAYKQPTSTQRANTYISYVQYAATTASGALDGLYVTGDNGY